MLFLTGMPGVGKTFWGRQIAAHYSLMHVDMDQQVVQSEGLSINELFMRYGEAGFREIEQHVLKHIVGVIPPTAVVSTGGGLVLNPENNLLMRRYGCIVCLRASLMTLGRQLAKEPHSRPLFEGRPLWETLEELQHHRAPYYQNADYTFSIETLNVEVFKPLITLCSK